MRLQYDVNYYVYGFTDFAVVMRLSECTLLRRHRMVNVVRLPCNLLADPEANVKHDLRAKSGKNNDRAEEHRNKGDMKKRLT